MSHSLSLGVTTSDPYVLNKNYSFSTSVTVNLKEDSSVLNPIFVLDYNANYSQYNYAYFPDWGRYYYLRNMIMKPGQKCELVCEVDPLMSFRNQISGLTVNVVRQENLVEPYLPDPNFVYLDTYDVISKLPTFDNQLFLNTPAGSTCYVLGVNGSFNTNLEDIEGYQIITSEPSDWESTYMNYFINVGTINNPQLKIIHAAYEDGNLDNGQGHSFAYIDRYYTIYQRV